MSTLESLKARIRSVAACKEDEAQLNAALELAELAHANQSRDEGTPYIFHPLRAAVIVIDEFHINDLRTIILAILHDVPEKDGGSPNEVQMLEIGKSFGLEIVRDLAALVTKIGNTRTERDAYYICEIKKSPLYVKLVKLADRLDNVRSLKFNPNIEKRVRYIGETERDFVPLARETHTQAYSELLNALDEARQTLK